MKLLKTFGVALCALLWSLSSTAHEWHDHAPVSMKSAIEIGLKTAAQYTQASASPPVGKLTESWAALEKSDASIHENGRGYYVVALNNKNENKTLYVKILLDGEIENANFTGEFPAASENPVNKNN